MKSLSGLLAIVAACGLLSIPAAGMGKNYFSAYDVLEIDDFENITAVGEVGGIRPPQVVLDAAKRDIIQRVIEQHLFRQVEGHEDGKAKGSGDGRLRMTGVVEMFDSKVHKGGGKGSLRLRIKIVDQVSGILLFDGTVAGKVSAWINKPITDVTVSELGKQVAKIIKENW
ncbi:MAG: hypothetical protein HYR55_15350 [Acidobacteria bacterium]|nr:hypothetical protein [Acidobacteriota bacterium]MBI3657761.1 hypothetical protein [Acidobacteriota bacterium]